MTKLDPVYLLRRLSYVRPGEPGRRIGMHLRRMRERRQYRTDPNYWSPERVWERRDTWLKVSPDDPVGEIGDALKSNTIERWWFDPEFWNSFKALYPNETELLVHRAERLLEDRFLLFHWCEVHVPAPHRWSSTLEKEYPDDEWPAVFHADAEFYHDSSRPNRDVKWCWELNRFQFLLALGAAARVTGDERFAQKAKEIIEGWIDTVRYPIGIQWSSNLEVALRALAWMRCYALLVDRDSWDSDFIIRLISILYVHGTHIENELSLYRSENNHLVGEASALGMLGRCLPIFAPAERWRNRCADILNELVPRLVYNDGTYGEHTTSYLRFTSEFLLPLSADPTNAGTMQPVTASLVRTLEWASILQPDTGAMPMIGDSDSGLAVGWGISDFWDFSPLFAYGAHVTGHERIAQGLDEFPAEAYLMCGPPGREQFLQARAAAYKPLKTEGRRSIRDWPAGGYRVGSCGEFRVLLDCAPLGLPPRYEHGHADALELLVWHRGMPIAVDPGTGLYNGNRVWRDYFRSTAAHNTVTIDGRSQCTPAGPFAWTRCFRVTPYPIVEGDRWRILAGTVWWPGRVRHSRYVIHVFESGLLCIDLITGDTPRSVTWSLHLDPRVRIEGGSRRAVSIRAEARRLEIEALDENRGDFQCYCGSLDPRCGWHSRLYSQWHPANTLVRTVEGPLPSVLASAIQLPDRPIEVPWSEVMARIPVEYDDLEPAKECITRACKTA